MGNKTRINFWLDAAMAAVFVFMQLPQATGVELHRIAGVALGVGVIAHLILHRKWIVAIAKSSGKPLPTTVQVSLLLSILLLVFFSMTFVSGLQNSPMPLPRTAAAHSAFMWHAIHNLSARLSLLIVIAHLALHRKRIVNALKRPHLCLIALRPDRNSIRKQEKKMKRILPPTLTLICLVAMIALAWAFPIETIFPFPTNILGVVPLGLGIFISASAEREFARVGTNINTFNAPDKLVTDGWFSRSRNPMYLGLTLVLIGAWMLMGSASPILGVLVFVVASNCWYIPFEEGKMTARFGQAYEDYKRRVRRWI